MGESWGIDRSRILDFHACPRRRWLGYHVGGTGLQRTAKALPLIYGGAVHEGLAILLQGQGIEAAVEFALKWLSDIFNEKGFALDGEEATDKAIQYAIKEQLALTEAMLRAWWAWEGPAFLESFEIIEVEKEGRAALRSGMELMFRPDALVRDRESGDCFVLSWKTTASYGQPEYARAMHDMQSLSEVWGIQQTAPVKIEGVIYKFLLKGKRLKDKYLGFYTQNTHLVYAWMRQGSTPEDTEWSWKYEFELDDGSGKSTRLGKGFRKVDVWSSYPGGTEAWIAALAANEITPRHISALESLFPQTLPVERRVDEVQDWLEQTTHEELKAQEDMTTLQQWPSHGDPRSWKTMLNIYAPQRTARCEDYRRCAFVDLCWTPTVAADPIGSGLYSIRVPNHPSEKEVEE